MINLLPLKNKKERNREFLRRLIVVLGLGFFFLALVEIVLLLALSSLADYYSGNINEQLLFVKKFAETKSLAKTETEIQNLNDLMAVFQENEKKIYLVSGGILEVLKVLPPGQVKINSFLFDALEGKKTSLKLSLEGRADTRKGLMDFVEDLKSEKYFKDIKLPISSLLTEKDVNFSLMLEL
ncbi:PilN domain-containing protein [Patescibacteria group bacterium]|nr:PilN domain-containing protein [Patescibacteria group bacterium]